MPQTIKQAPIKNCETCGVLMERKRFNGRLEDYAVFLRRRFCSMSCGNTRPSVTKDAHHWRARKHRAEKCAQCSAAVDLHVHHIDRNHENDDPLNLITLCSSCHLKLHWREDRAKRMAAVGQPRRPDQACVICGAPHHPRWTKRQTCSPECKAILLSRRTTEHYLAK